MHLSKTHVFIFFIAKICFMIAGNIKKLTLYNKTS